MSGRPSPILDQRQTPFFKDRPNYTLQEAGPPSLARPLGLLSPGVVEIGLKRRGESRRRRRRRGAKLAREEFELRLASDGRGRTERAASLKLLRGDSECRSDDDEEDGDESNP